MDRRNLHANSGLAARDHRVGKGCDINAPSQQGLSRLEAVGGVPLGVLDETTYEDAQIELQPGQTLVLYTDGITEARSPDGAMFGVESIDRALVDCTGDPACVVQSITDILHDHQAGVRPNDDQTIIAIRVE